VKPEAFRHYWRWFYLAAALEAGAAFLALARVPRDASAGIVLGYSPARLGLLALLLGFLLAWGYMALRPPRLHAWTPPVGLIAAAGLLALLAGAAAFLLHYADPPRSLPIYQRLAPLLFYLLLLSIEAGVWLMLVRFGFNPQAGRARKTSITAGFTAFGALIGLLIVTALTGLGVTPDEAYWAEPGVPVLAWQLGAAVLGGALVLLASLWLLPGREGWQGRRADAALAFGLWALAVVIWLGVPKGVMARSFYAPIVPPSNQPLPVADAALYDYLSQSILLGTAYVGWIPPRPLYVMFLAALHAVFGQDYGSILAAQTCLLALFPVVLYFLGARLHSRAAGVVAALLAIFRELTSLWVASETRVSNTRTLLTDLPTALMIAAAALLVMRWLEQKSLQRAVLAGGFFGALLLLRTQSLVILPVIALLAGLHYWRPARAWMRDMTMFVLAAAVCVAPWLAHNYAALGRLTFDDPTQLALLSSQYAEEDHLPHPEFRPEESVARHVVTYALQHPGTVAGFVANHFMAAEIGGVLVLPLIKPYPGLFAPVNVYWVAWDGRLEWYNLGLVVLYLAVMALGLGAAWQRLRWIGLAPLAFNLGYALANGAARYSGWRYNLPVDWIPFLYFSLGAVEIMSRFALSLGARVDRIFPPPAPVAPAIDRSGGWSLATAAILAGFALLGSLPWILQVSVPPHFEALSSAQLEERLARTPGAREAGASPDAIRAFNSGTGAVLLRGRMLYPRFYLRNAGVVQTTPWPAYAVRDYARLGFLLLDRNLTHVILPGRTLPAGAEQGAEAVVLGCQRDDYVEARLIALPETGLIYKGAPLSEPCPP
jgi:hypothetical protein